MSNLLFLLYQKAESISLLHPWKLSPVRSDSSQQSYLMKAICFQRRDNSPNQKHRMMMRGDNTYLKIGGNRYTESSPHRVEFHWIVIEGCLVQRITKSVLSRITEPIQSKFSPSPLKVVNDGRSTYIIPFNLTSHCQCVL